MKNEISIKPYPISYRGSEYARHVWFSGYGVPRGVFLRTTAQLPPEFTDQHKQLWRILAKVCRAASAAILEHPRLNYYTFWGKPVWGGQPPRVNAIIENEDFSCDMALIEAAHEKDEETIIRELQDRSNISDHGKPLSQLERRMPLLHFFIERFTGVYERKYCSIYAPLWISMVGLSEIEDVAYTPAHSMALYPSLQKDGELRLTLCFNHQLANARPVGRFLIAIKKILE
jgi:hypothetical protein